jgi:hypothetical protein
MNVEKLFPQNEYALAIVANGLSLVPGLVSSPEGETKKSELKA